MTSRRQAAQDRYDHILPFIEEAANEYYGGNLDRGFRHWAFATIFADAPNIQGNDIVEYTAIDGSDDFEIDGYFIPDSDDDSVVHLFQSKRRQPDTSMGASELAAFLNAPNRILSVAEVSASKNEETKALHDQIVALLSTHGVQCSINLIWATSGRLTPSARTHADQRSSFTVKTTIRGNPVDVPVTFEHWDLDRLYEFHSRLQSSDEVSKCDFTFKLPVGSYHQTESSADYRTLSMTVSARQIIEVFARHGFQVFRLNPRGPLGNKVNRAIKRTLLDETERRRFHVLNNGLTAICDSWRLSGDDLVVQNFQIINGCQTTVTLWDARAALADDDNVLVTVKLTECPEHFAPKIAETTNSQTALRAEDFTSNETVQVRLQREFSSMNPPWFYQIKRGEWSKMLGGQREKEAYREPSGGYRQLNLKDVAQAVVAFAGYPGEAKDKIRSFLNKDTVSSIARESEFSYDQIYSDTVASVQLLLPAVVQRKIWRQVTEDKATQPWLEYARFHLIWLIGKLLKDFYNHPDALFSSQRSSVIAAHIDEWFKPLYDVAVAAISVALVESERRGDFTGYREFFRSPANYRFVETNVEGALRLASNFGNPTANLPR